ncbi:MAG TPA: helix-turn-helix domain-containing protein, partial [Rhodopila sp.]|nr:helix-turn-helix domain-containing protein [Rhodopila sp.]
TSEALEDALLRDAPSRVARGILRLAATFGRKEGAALRIDIRLSQQQLGNLIGISRESVNKYLMEWSRAGYLAMDHGVITIKDQEALSDLAEAEV